MMPEIEPLEPGEPRQLGPFRILGRIGEGGQGVVYLGVNATGERAAIKLLHVKFSGDAIARSRFAREARAAQRVASFCTASVLDVDLEGDTPYIASEYIEGRPLREVVETDGPLRGSALQRLAVGTVTALTAIHQASIVHRDFKPDNVLMAADGPRVVDFGIARILDSTGTITSRAIGTPAYMAPEQIAGTDVGPYSDVFSWGATIAFAATGETVFAGASIAVVLNRILNHDPDLGPMPEPLRGVVRSALAKEPDARPSADQLLLRLLGYSDTANASPAILTQGARIATRRNDRDRTHDAVDPARPRGDDHTRGEGHDRVHDEGHGRDRAGASGDRPAESGDGGDATSPIRAPGSRTGRPSSGTGTDAPQDGPSPPSTGFPARHPAQDRPDRVVQPPQPSGPAQAPPPVQPVHPTRVSLPGQDTRRPLAHGEPLPPRTPAEPSPGPEEPSHDSTELLRSPAERPPSSGRREGSRSSGYVGRSPADGHQDRRPPSGYPEHPSSQSYPEHSSSPSHAEQTVYKHDRADVPPPIWQAESVRGGGSGGSGRSRKGRWIAASVAVLLVAVAAVAATRWWPVSGSDVGPTKSSAGSGTGAGATPFTSVADKAAKTRKLTIGMRDFLPGIALKNTDGTWSGFEVDLALEIAKALGVPESGVTFQATRREDRPKLLADGDVDLVLATYPINATDDVTFAGPYYVAHVDALVKADSPILNVRGLEGRRICEPTGSASVAILERKVQRLTPVPAQHYAECVDKLEAGEVDAIPGDDLLLAGYGNRESTRYKVLGLKLTDERYAVALKKGDVRTCEAVKDVITDLYENGTVGRLLDKHFSNVEFPSRENDVPTMSACR
ncbi:hypothetical protein GCM10010517_48480 [Streptosporangium fragile]|uniref:non-specific serine/threonine protein kinase n=1 Tax=Streptosporangium fragile TaxID=46186 RepID=A0ABN3W266_9ACTN